MTYRSKLKKTIGWKRIFYGNYEMNRRGKIRRVTAANGTRPGKFLHPYYPNGSDATVRLYRADGNPYQTTVAALRARHFPAY